MMFGEKIKAVTKIVAVQRIILLNLLLFGFTAQLVPGSQSCPPLYVKKNPSAKNPSAILPKIHLYCSSFAKKAAPLNPRITNIKGTMQQRDAKNPANKEPIEVSNAFRLVLSNIVIFG
jgi:hypothetical protein